MEREKWERVKDIFEAAVGRAAVEREQFLADNCLGDDDVRREVESLLASFDGANSFLQKPAVGEVAELVVGKNNQLADSRQFGHYEIIRQIGAGGMGEVYLAKDTKLDRRVAVKILNEQFSRNESNLARFIREAKAASGLNHPNILVIHEIGESEDAHFIVSEFIEGETLREIIKESSLKLSEVLEISIQITNALAAAHAAHIIHRDIKPENIIVRPDGFVKILDFGLAKLVEQKPIGLEASTVKQNQTAKGVILGTINYMSPEQAKGEKVDERTDIFSFGVVLYEMIAGRTPFAGDSVSETFANLIIAEPQRLLRFSSNVPDELERITAKTLRKKKDERYQTMKDLSADLKSLRENLAFDERSEKSHQPSGENTAAVSPPPAMTGDANKQTDENYQFTEQIKRHKSFAALISIVLLVGAIGLVYYFLSARKMSSSADGRKSLAVLPFVNLTQDTNAEYLSDGITESVINNLSQLSGLKVMSRNSAFRFKNNQTDTQTIASQLGVEAIITGDIKQLGEKLIINVRLINAADDSQIWGNQYVRTSADIITAQNEISRDVSRNLGARLSGADERKLAKRETENPEAYQLYMKGRYHLSKLKPSEMQIAALFYQQAIELDPNYALAYAGLAGTYRVYAIAGAVPAAEVFPKAKAAAQKAVELDDTLADAHLSLGSDNLWYDWDWSAAENQFRRALELDPNDAITRINYALLLSNTGRHAEALAEARRARELSPLELPLLAMEGQCLLHAGRVDEALDRLQKTAELEPNFWMPHHFAASAYIEKGMFAEAIAEADKEKELQGFNTIPFGVYALAKSGKPAEARAALEELLKLSTTGYVPPYNIALIYNALDESSNALYWLEKAYEQRDPKMIFLKVEPKWNNLRNEPRFIALMKRMNFE